MVNPADWLKKGVTKLHGWLEKAEREELEQRLDIAKELEDPRGDLLSDDPDQPRVVDLESPEPATPAPAAPPTPAAKPATPPPPAPPQFASSGYPGAAPRGIAGLTKRESGQRDDDQRIVINDTNDTMYRQRDMLVTAIRERYAGYGPRVATAMLQRVLLPNGIELVLAKLGLKSRGNADRDHDQITDFLDKRGVEPFCEALGIKAESSGAAPRPAVGRSGSDSSSQGGRSGTGGERPPRLDSTDPHDMERRRLNAQLSQNAVEKGASHAIKLQKVNVKPINLGGTTPPPAAATAPPPSAVPRVSLYPQATPMPKAHTNTPAEPPTLAQVPAPKPAAFPSQPKPAIPPSAITTPPIAGADPRATQPSPRPTAFQPWKTSAAPPHLIDTNPTSPDPNTPPPTKSAADYLADEMDSDRFPKPS